MGAINHAATGRPTILGELETGTELTAATTGIQDQNGLPGTFAYQWFRNDGTGDTPIDGARESILHHWLARTWANRSGSR